MRTVPLGDVADFINGFAFKPEDWHEDGLPIIRIQNLTDATKSINLTRRTVPDKFRVRRGEILVSWSATLGVFVWDRTDEALVNQHIFRVVPAPNVDQDFLRHMLTGALVSMDRHLHGATMRHINRREFLTTEIPLPALREQRRIAAILDHADALRAKRRRVLAHLDALTQSIFHDMFGDPVHNSGGLPLVKLRELGTLDRGVSKHRPRNEPALLGGRHPLIQTGDVANSGGYITGFSATYSDQGLAQSRMWPAGTLCITIAANIAKTGILTFDACFPDSVVGFSADLETTSFVRVWLSFLQSTLEASAPQSAQKNINLAILRELDVPTPSRSELVEFAARVGRVNDQRAAVKRVLAAHEELFGSLQSRAFKGEL